MGVANPRLPLTYSTCEGCFILNRKKKIVSEVAKNTVISSFHNFRERMTTGSTLSMGLRIFMEVSLTYVKRIKWFGSLFVPLLKTVAM